MQRCEVGGVELGGKHDHEQVHALQLEQVRGRAAQHTAHGGAQRFAIRLVLGTNVVSDSESLTTKSAGGFGTSTVNGLRESHVPDM
jgi:hypothetical protein